MSWEAWWAQVQRLTPELWPDDAELVRADFEAGRTPQQAQAQFQQDWHNWAQACDDLRLGA